MKNILVNICGPSRSGSTMLDLMLGNDQNAFSLGECYAWFRPFRTHHFKIICSCGKKNCPWEKIKALKEHEFHKKCFKILGVDILVDSSKNLPWVIDNNIWARKNGISVHNVLLFKEPISFFYSFYKRGIPHNHAKNVFKKYYNRFFHTNIPYITLNYNLLVSEPATSLKKICDLLEIPYFVGKERFWEKEHHHLYGSRGTRKQIEDSKSQIKKQEDYQQDYKNIIPKIVIEIKKDKTFQNILMKLRSREMQSEKPTIIKIHKPYWYYFSKAKQKLRKQFPERWKYNQ